MMAARDVRCRQATVTGMTTTKGLAALLAIHLAVAAPLLVGGAMNAHAESGSGSDGSGGGSDSSGSGSGGGGSDNSGSGSDNSGHGGGGDDGDGSGNSGSGRSGGDDGDAGGDYSGGDPIGRFMEALGAFGGVESSQRDGGSIELHYDDGWREVISNGRYRLFDRQGRQVVGRAANRLDFERMDAARR